MLALDASCLMLLQDLDMIPIGMIDAYLQSSVLESTAHALVATLDRLMTERNIVCTIL